MTRTWLGPRCWTRERRAFAAALVVLGLVGSPGGAAFAEVPDAVAAVAAGDCKAAGDAINLGLQRNDPQAYFLAGYLYDRTACVTSDPARAEKLYRHAIVLGDLDARTYLGLLYGLGRGVTQDYAMAHRAFAGMPSTDTGAVAAAPDEGAIGYVETVVRLAVGRVAYPTTANLSGIEASMDVVLDVESAAVRFEHVKVGIEAGSHMPRNYAFTEPVEEAYQAVIAVLRKPSIAPGAPTTYDTPWTFQMRRGLSGEKLQTEGYVTVGDTVAER